MPRLGSPRCWGHSHSQGPRCPTVTAKTGRPPPSRREPALPRPPGTPPPARGAAMRLLVLLATLVPPALGSWGVAYPESLRGVRGSCVMIPCTLSYPGDVAAADGIVAIWYKDYSTQKVLVYHSAAQEVDARFRGRAQLLGDPATRNCTLLLRGVTPEDSGPYRFRFEIVNGDRWLAMREVMLSVSDDLEHPSVAASEEQTEGQTSTLECSTPYGCPPGDVALRWEGYDPQVSTVSGRVRLDTNEVSQRLTLTTSFSWKDHSKKLLCQVSYGSRRASGEVVLRVRHAPKDAQVSVDPPAQNIRVGDAVSLTCEVSSSYPPISGYRWYKDGVAVGSRRVLALRDIRRTDYGQYHCEAENAVGAGAAPAVMLYIFSAEISVSPAAEVREGTATTLSCDVPGRGGQDLNYTWYKNGAWLEEGTAHTLFFPHAAASDAGFYSCKVTNDRGSDTSQPITLSVTYPPRPPAVTLFQETPGGRLAVIRCAVDSHPPATMALYRDGTLLAASSSAGAPRPRPGLTVTPNSLRLEIRGAGPGDSGEYRCTASNAYGNASAAKLFVARATEVLIQPSAEVREGEPVTLTCLGAGGGGGGDPLRLVQERQEAAGELGPDAELPLRPRRGRRRVPVRDPEQRRQRRLGGRPAPGAVPAEATGDELLPGHPGRAPGHHPVHRRERPRGQPDPVEGGRSDSLHAGLPCGPHPRVHATSTYNSLRVEIRDVVLEDEGTYLCWAGNPQGNASSTVEFRAETASIAVSPSSHVLEGHAVNLTCRLSSISPALPNISWYRNGQRLAQSSATSLVFGQVASADAGLYRCRATVAGRGRSSPAVSLDVLYPPRDPHFTAFLETERGRLAIFQCSVASNPPAELALHRGEELVATGAGGSSPRVSASATPNTLRVEVREVTPADEGSYSCTATNAHGAASRRLYFRVQTAQVLISPSAEVREGDDVSLRCQVAGEPRGDTVYSWYKDSRWLQEGPENLLELPRIASAAAGSYHCRAHSPAATSVSPAVALRISYPPRAPVLTFLLEPPEGQWGVLQCTVDSSPRAELALFKDRALVASTSSARATNPPRVTVTSAFNTLRVSIRPVLLEDEGEYVCSAGNTYGNASAAANFTAGAARVWISPSPDVREGEAVNLTCGVRSGGGEALSYTWYKNRVWFGSGATPALAFPSVAAADAASYHCSVRTPARSHSSAPATLNVLWRAKPSFTPSPVSEPRQADPAKQPHGGCRRFRRSFPKFVLKLGTKLKQKNLWLSGNAAKKTALTYKSAVRNPPRNLQMKAFTESGEGTAVILLCAVESNPLSEITLLKGGQPVASSPPAGGDHHPGQSGHISPAPNALRLELRKPSEEDEGEYECRARSPLGSASMSVPLRVWGVSVVVRPSAEVPEGTDVTLTCRAGGAPPGTLYIWSKNGRWLAEGPGATLALPGVQRTDAGAYGCQAGRGVRGRRAPPAALRVLWLRGGVCVCVSPRRCRVSHRTSILQPAANVSPPPTPTPREGRSLATAGRGGGGINTIPVLADAPQEPSFISLVEPRGGQQAVLLCTVDSFPPSDIALHRGPGHAPLASTQGPADPRFTVQATPNSLRVGLGGLGPGDAGLYVCSANNSYGTAASSLRLDVGGVTVTVEPSAEVPEGTTATVTCSAVPWVGEEANYTWYKNSRWLREGPAGSFVLTPVSSADAGSYRCRASGARGSATSAPLSLRVLYPPRDVSVSTFLENRSGRVGIVLCTADSHPAATIALYRRGQLLASSRSPATAPGVRASPSHNTLRLDLGAVGPEDSGEYVCVAGNPLGNATAGAYFDVHTLTHLLLFTVLAGLLVAAICVATLALLAVKMWPRIRKFWGWSGAEDTFELRSKQEQAQVDGAS
ncbi:LOW QUALITY PROTEIN: sialoadhesin-like [Tyto alba]|uniref:LOW QUALITY PROTEIN: sialoadhesin-like n=1 Tax=Tyto alba TaxID=56313 RepID=UPI001C66B3C5|nr:LOW QUALITY PROTEIN: sialoadhesin-like [Tyto alba]